MEELGTVMINSKDRKKERKKRKNIIECSS